MPDLSPPSLQWSTLVVRQARAFFGTVNPEARRLFAEAVGHNEREGHFTPFRLIDFLNWLGHIEVEHTERRTNDINGLLEGLVAENLLLQAGSDGSLLGQRYVGG